MAKETLREQNERLVKELKEARAQIQQLQQEVAKANEEIRLLNLERATAIENMAYAQDIRSDAYKDSYHYKILSNELEVAHSDCHKLKNENKQLKEDKEVLQQKIKDLEHSVEECHKETTEAYKSMSEMLDKHEKELSKSQRKIWKLEDENKKFQERSENLKNPFGAGRKKNDAAYIKRYVEFSSLVRKGMSMEDIMGTMQISRSTYFRFLKVFKEDQEIDEREKSMKNNK